MKERIYNAVHSLEKNKIQYKTEIFYFEMQFLNIEF